MENEDRDTLLQAQNHETKPGTSILSLPTDKTAYYPIKLGVDDEYHTHSDGARIGLSHCGDGLVFPPRIIAQGLDCHGQRFGLDALEEVIDKYGKPKIMTTDQGSRFTSLFS